MFKICFLLRKIGDCSPGFKLEIKSRGCTSRFRRRCDLGAAGSLGEMGAVNPPLGPEQSPHKVQCFNAQNRPSLANIYSPYPSSIILIVSLASMFCTVYFVMFSIYIENPEL